MAIRCPIGFDTERLRAEVSATYEAVARDPSGEFHFHRGADYATSVLGYLPADVYAVPEASRARFAGVGNPLAVGAIRSGETVLDHACGAGMDLLIAARKVGPLGKAIGVDITPGMRAVATRSASEVGLSKVVDVRAGDYADLPAETESVDVVISNGVLNLAPDKERVLAEVFRVLRPGGRLMLADVVVRRELTWEARRDPTLWAACIAGALHEPELPALAAEVGFVEARIVDRYDCFRGTSAEAKVSKDLRVEAVTFSATKPRGPGAGDTA